MWRASSEVAFGSAFDMNVSALWDSTWPLLTSSLTWSVMVYIALNYISTGIYAYTFIKNIYVTSRQRREQQRAEIENIQRQIDIVDMKVEVSEREQVLFPQKVRQQLGLLRETRERFRRLVNDDNALKRSLARSLDNSAAFATHADKAEVPKVVAREHIAGDKSPRATSSSDDSLYSSLSDTDCQLKIIRVTRLIRITKTAYVKQKQLRRSTKQTLLKKKKENIKKILEDWQRYLNMVINKKLSTLSVGATSYAAMGDYSNFRDLSDSSSDLRTDNGDDRADPAAQQHPDTPGTMESGDSGDFADQRHAAAPLTHRLDGVPADAAALFTLHEETSSQVAMEETNEDYC